MHESAHQEPGWPVFDLAGCPRLTTLSFLGTQTKVDLTNISRIIGSCDPSTPLQHVKLHIGTTTRHVNVHWLRIRQALRRLVSIQLVAVKIEGQVDDDFIEDLEKSLDPLPHLISYRPTVTYVF